MTLSPSRLEIPANRVEHPISILSILACPSCLGSLETVASGVRCCQCNVLYPYSENGVLDLRLKNPKKYRVEYVLESELIPEGLEPIPLVKHRRPEVDFSQVKAPNHLSPELMSYFPAPKKQGAMVLDLGCGDTVHRAVCEEAGFEYVGLDYATSEAPLLGDGQSLPFVGNVFQFVLSVAVLEHIRFPSVMAAEVNRVLEPGGLFIGTVAFLEPFHGNSFYHHTHLGVINTLRSAGFQIEKLAPSSGWSVLIAQSNMGLFPQMPSPLSKLLVMPLQLLHKMWWQLARLAKKGKAKETDRLTNLAGSFIFIARKLG